MEKKILSAMYDGLLENLSPTQEYRRLQRKFEKERERFLNNIEEQDSQSLEKLTDVLYEMNDELNKQVFYEGFSLAVKLFIEATSKE